MYDGMMIRPDAARGKHIWEVYPELRRRRELCSIPEVRFTEKDESSFPTLDDLHHTILFCSLLCDPESPHYRERNWQVRLEVCMEAAGISRGSVMAKRIEDMHWWYCDVLAAFLRLLNNTDFETWVSATMNAFVFKQYLRTPLIDAEDIEKNMATREKIEKALSGIDNRIKELEMKLFPDEKARKAVSLSITADGLGGWAEKFAMSKE